MPVPIFHSLEAPERVLDIGVGKTTFVNYHRYLWQAEAKTKLLTPATEISVQRDWGMRELLLNVLTLLAGRLSLSMSPKEVESDRLLAEEGMTGTLATETAKSLLEQMSWERVQTVLTEAEPCDVLLERTKEPPNHPPEQRTRRGHRYSQFFTPPDNTRENRDLGHIE